MRRVLLGLLLVLLIAAPAAAQSPTAVTWTQGSIAAPEGWVPTDLLAWDEGLAMTVRTSAGETLWLSDDGTTWRPTDPTGLPAQATARGLTTTGHDLLAWATDAPVGGVPRTSVAVTADGETWSVAPADGSAPFGTTAIAGMARAADGTLAAWGVDRGAAGTDRPVMWLFTGDGWTWSGSRLEDRRGRMMAVTAIAPMGLRMVAFGQGRGWGGGSDTWLAYDPTSAWWQGHAPRAIGAVPSIGADAATVAVGSIAGAALVTAPDGRRALWASRNAFDWWTVDSGTLPFTLGPETALTDASGTLIATGVEAATGRRGLWMSDDGRAWVAAVSGDPAPTAPGMRQVAVHGGTIVIALPGQVWSAPWAPEDASESVVVAPFIPLAAVEPGPVVRRPKGSPPVLATDRPADARTDRRGISLELWVPQRTLGIGAWLPATIRVTNDSARTVVYNGSLDDLRCHPVAGATAETSALFDPGETWTGHAARWKRQVIELSTGVGLDTWPHGPGRTCADIGFISRLAPGESFTVPFAGWLVGPVGRQAVPAGTVPVTAFFSFDEPGRGQDGIVLRATAPVRTEGRPWRSITPGQLADAALRTPGFKAWLDERDPEAWGWQVVADLEHDRTPPGRAGATMPDPPVVAQLGLYAESWTGRGWSWLIRLDPRTGAFYGGGQS